MEVITFQEESRWRQRAKLVWAKEGDNNTSFFHKMVNGRRKRNFIERIEVDNGLLEENESIIEQDIISFYKNLYSSTFDECWGLEGLDWHQISDEQTVWLERPFELEKVKRAVFDCGKDKSPSPDGFSLAVLQRNWEVVKGDLFRVMEEFYSNGVINKATNETYICLIPKKTNSINVTDFRSISLTSLFKIIIKVLAGKLKEVLENTISYAQGGCFCQK